MKLIKQWHVSFYGENDIEYVKGLDCEFEVHDTMSTKEITASNGQRYRIIDSTNPNYGLYITTKNKKQESLLMLKYSSDIKLLRMFYVNEWTRYELLPDF